MRCHDRQRKRPANRNYERPLGVGVAVPNRRASKFRPHSTGIVRAGFSVGLSHTSWPPPAHAPNQVGVIVDAAALSRPTTVLGIEGTPQEFGVAVGSLDSGSRFIDVDLYVDFRVTEKNKSAWPDLGAPGTSASNSFEDSPPFLLPPSMSPLRRVAPCPD